MLKKKDKIIGKIKALNPNGLGIIEYEKQIVLVKDVFVDEKVEVVITNKVKEGFFGKVIRFIEKSSKRAKVKCPYFEKCGGCDYLYMLYPFELANKRHELVSLLEKRRLKARVADVVGMENPYHYRNKMILTFKRKKQLEVGFYAQGSHDLISIDKCLLHDEQANDLIMKLKRVVSKSKLDIYDERTRRGFLRHIQVRQNSDHSQLLITLVTNGREFKGKKNFLKILLKDIPEVTTVVQNINKRDTSIVLENEEIILYGKGYITDTLLGMKFRISSRSFYQINHEQCEKLYQKAIDLLDLKENETVIDAYCGVGTIGMLASKYCQKVYGVEVNRDAIKDAKINAQLNNVDNIEFINDDAGKYMKKLAVKRQKVDAVIMDPTREGSDENFMDALLALKPKKVVYISCNPKTQVRDLKYLSKAYKFNEIIPVDMFPRTKHMECICLLSRKK